MVQKKDTPRRNPRNRGGSPTGVRQPPIFDTMNMKNITIRAFFFPPGIARMRGLIMSMEAPVVPIQLARAVPIRSITRLDLVVPTIQPFITIPPAVTKRPNRRTMKGM